MRRAFRYIGCIAAASLVGSAAYGSVELCSELMGESYELETFEPVLVAMEKAPEQDVLDSLSEATQRVSQTSTFISNDVFANKYERELARSVTDAAVGVEKALSNKDVRELFPAYEVLMETVEYLSAACFREAPAPQENPAGTPGQNSD